MGLATFWAIFFSQTHLVTLILAQGNRISLTESLRNRRQPNLFLSLFSVLIFFRFCVVLSNNRQRLMVLEFSWFGP
jgi:hypothetical protein